MLLIKKGIATNRKGLMINSKAVKIIRKISFLKKEITCMLYILSPPPIPKTMIFLESSLGGILGSLAPLHPIRS